MEIKKSENELWQNNIAGENPPCCWCRPCWIYYFIASYCVGHSMDQGESNDTSFVKIIEVV